jgi:hypothetical protein
LLGLIRDEISALAAPEAEGNLSAEIPAPRLLIRLHLPDALADAIPLRLCKGGGDGEEQLTQAIPAMSPPRFEQVELYAPRLEAFDDLERIEGAVASAPRRRARPKPAGPASGAKYRAMRSASPRRGGMESANPEGRANHWRRRSVC